MTHFNFYQSWTSGLTTMVHKNAIARRMSTHSRLVTYNSIAIIRWNLSANSGLSFSSSSLVSKRYFAASVAALLMLSSGELAMAPLMCSFIHPDCHSSYVICSIISYNFNNDDVLMQWRRLQANLIDVIFTGRAFFLVIPSSLSLKLIPALLLSSAASLSSKL
jgi:hypothetical protein